MHDTQQKMWGRTSRRRILPLHNRPFIVHSYTVMAMGDIAAMVSVTTFCSVRRRNLSWHDKIVIMMMTSMVLERD